MTTLNRIAGCAVAAAVLSFPTASFAQQYAMLQVTEAEHERAKRQQTEEDHRKHTGAKVVGGTAAGGAVIGALAGGGKGALIGGAAGAGGGAIANKVRKDKAVKKRETRDNPQ
jgi:outer membrane lipoprotein SlyB